MWVLVSFVKSHREFPLLYSQVIKIEFWSAGGGLSGILYLGKFWQCEFWSVRWNHIGSWLWAGCHCVLMEKPLKHRRVGLSSRGLRGASPGASSQPTSLKKQKTPRKSKISKKSKVRQLQKQKTFEYKQKKQKKQSFQVDEAHERGGEA